jgi:hypothetical protein
MGYSRDYLHYPPEIGEAVEKVCSGGGPIVFRCGSSARAASIRGQFYAYFRALREAAYKEGIPDRDRVVELHRLAGQVAVRTYDVNVVLAMKDLALEMQDLAQLIKEQEK